MTRRRRRIMTIAITLACIYVAYLIVGFAIQRTVLFPRHVVIVPPPGAAEMDDSGLQRHTLDTEAGAVDMWYLPGAGAEASDPGPAVIFAHGNAELIDHWPALLEPYRRMGVGVLLIEYRGYGRSAGSPSQRAITDDFVQGHDWLAARPEVDADRIIFHGRSIGTGVVCSLGEQRRPAALILQSPFTSIKAMAWRMGYPGFLMRDPFDNAAFVEAYDGPVLILHGRRDRIIAFDHGQRLHQLASNSTFREYTCGHNDFPVNSERYWGDVEEFLVGAGLILDERRG